jgi:cell wall-associated NlpC family hydrolase
MNATHHSPLDLIGIPYASGGANPAAGFDCWGLVEYVRRECYGLNSPLVTDDERSGVRALRTIEFAKKNGQWFLIDPPGDPGSVVGMSFMDGARLHHVGVSLGARGVLHAWCGVLSRGRGSVTLTPWARLRDIFKVVEVYTWRV